MINWFLFSLAFVVILGMVGLWIVIASEESEEESFFAPVESGFSATSSFASFFSLQHFLIMILFVIFDVEILFIFGTFFGGGTILMSISVLLFFIIGGLWLEWCFGKLSWML